MAKALRVNGTNLGDHAYLPPDLSSLLTVPRRRGENVAVPGRHGQIRTPGKRFDANDVVLPLYIAGARADGSIPTGSTDRLEFYKRRDELLRIFYADEVLLEVTREDDSEVTTACEVADVMDFTQVKVDPCAQVNIALTLLDAFWRDVDPVSQTITGTTGATATLTAFAPATAPMADLQITFVGPVNNPKLTIGNAWVQFNGVISTGRELLLDIGQWDVSPGGGASWTPDPRFVSQGLPGAWLELDPAVSPFSAVFNHTGGGSASVEISGYRAYLAP